MLARVYIKWACTMPPMLRRYALLSTIYKHSCLRLHTPSTGNDDAAPSRYTIQTTFLFSVLWLQCSPWPGYSHGVCALCCWRMVHVVTKLAICCRVMVYNTGVWFLLLMLAIAYTILLVCGSTNLHLLLAYSPQYAAGTCIPHSVAGV